MTRTEWTELALRLSVTVGFAGSLVGLATSLSVSPTWIWAGLSLGTGIFSIWLWRRWLERWELDRDRSTKPAVEMPVRQQEFPVRADEQY